MKRHRFTELRTFARNWNRENRNLKRQNRSQSLRLFFLLWHRTYDDFSKRNKYNENNSHEFDARTLHGDAENEWDLTWWPSWKPNTSPLLYFSLCVYVKLVFSSWSFQLTIRIAQTEKRRRKQNMKKARTNQTQLALYLLHIRKYVRCC